MEGKYPKVKDVLLLLGITGFVVASIVLPGLPLALKPFLKKDYKKWGHFNKRRLKSELQRLKSTGIIEEFTEEGEIVFRLTEKGKQKLFKYKLEDMVLKSGNWDRKWRLVIYDIPKGYKNQADAFRRLIKKMELLQIQKSVYLTPYPCKDEIDFLKTMYEIGDYVTVLTVSGIESEEAYRKYFGI